MSLEGDARVDVDEDDGRTMDANLAEAAREAAARFGTPFYLYDLGRLRHDARVVARAFPDPWLRLYALKANGLPPLIAEIAQEGFGVSAVSGGELRLARRGGLLPAQIALEGIGKTPADLRQAVRLAAAGEPLLWTSLESSDEAAQLAALVRAARRRSPGTLRIDVLVRLNPQVRPETHPGLAVGATSSKFGVLPEEVAGLVAAGGGPDGPLRWRGLHVHVGSQLGAIDAWRAALRVGAALLGLQRAELPDFDTLDAGGGFPVLPDGIQPSPARFADTASAILDALDPSARPTRLAVEPGRAVVARAGWLIARVLHTRAREPRQVVLDAGMSELLRPALYGARHPAVALSLGGRPTDEQQLPVGPVRLEGPVCESTDSLGDFVLPQFRRGDLVGLGQAGAYGASMASTYNGRPRPPAVAWDGHELRLWRRRDRPSNLA